MACGSAWWVRWGSSTAWMRSATSVMRSDVFTAGIVAPKKMLKTLAAPADNRRQAMNSLSSIAQSGIGAAALRLDSAAHNIANGQTPGFRRQVVQQEALPEGGVVVS